MRLGVRRGARPSAASSCWGGVPAGLILAFGRDTICVNARTVRQFVKHSIVPDGAGIRSLSRRFSRSERYWVPQSSGSLPGPVRATQRYFADCAHVRKQLERFLRPFRRQVSSRNSGLAGGEWQCSAPFVGLLSQKFSVPIELYWVASVNPSLNKSPDFLLELNYLF